MEFFIFFFGLGCGFLVKNAFLMRKIVFQKIQLVAVFLELKMYRYKKIRPHVKDRDKFYLGLLHLFSLSFLDYVTFRPSTLIRWHKNMVQHFWKSISAKKQKHMGRPTISDDVIQLVLHIAKENKSYKHKKIAEILNHQLNINISASSVKSILKKYYKDNPPASDQRFSTFLTNHVKFMVSMDFKVAFDWRAKPLFILNIIHHGRRNLLLSRSTYYPNNEWVSQQLREVLSFDVDWKYIIMDNDSTFRSLKKFISTTLNIKPIYTAYKCPWQNGIVERFNQTLKLELLDHIIPLSPRHLNNLLYEYTQYYNHGRCHRGIEGEIPVQNNHANREGKIIKIGNNYLEKIVWCNGVHHSYKLAS